MNVCRYGFLFSCSTSLEEKFHICYPSYSMNAAVNPRGDSHMKQTGMLVGNFEFNP